MSDLNPKNRNTYTIKHARGISETGFTSYADAVDAVRSVYKSAAIGHDGDISEGGRRTLCWVDDEIATDDDGSRACCAIVGPPGMTLAG